MGFSPANIPTKFSRVIAFIDGENLACRFQDMKEAGKGSLIAIGDIY